MSASTKIPAGDGPESSYAHYSRHMEQVGQACNLRMRWVFLFLENKNTALVFKMSVSHKPAQIPSICAIVLNSVQI